MNSVTRRSFHELCYPAQLSMNSDARGGRRISLKYASSLSIGFASCSAPWIEAEKGNLG